MKRQAAAQQQGNLLGSVIQAAREQENQKPIEPENQISGIAENWKEGASEDDGGAAVEMVNLSIKVPVHLRVHWAAEAKRRRTTLTAAITMALTERFGEPETE